MNLVEMSTMLRTVHKHPWLMPKNTLPNWAGYDVGLSWDYMRKRAGICFMIDNSRSIERTRHAYRPIQ